MQSGESSSVFFLKVHFIKKYNLLLLAGDPDAQEILLHVPQVAQGKKKIFTYGIAYMYMHLRTSKETTGLFYL